MSRKAWVVVLNRRARVGLLGLAAGLFACGAIAGRRLAG
jgi:hypothetical protein